MGVTKLLVRPVLFKHWAPRQCAAAIAARGEGGCSGWRASCLRLRSLPCEPTGDKQRVECLGRSRRCRNQRPTWFQKQNGEIFVGGAGGGGRDDAQLRDDGCWSELWHGEFGGTWPTEQTGGVNARPESSPEKRVARPRSRKPGFAKSGDLWALGRLVYDTPFSRPENRILKQSCAPHQNPRNMSSFDLCPERLFLTRVRLTA